MICCILALFVAGPLGILLVPMREPQRNAIESGAACCRRKQELWRAASVLLTFLLLTALFATALHFLDPPMFQRFCTFHVFR